METSSRMGRPEVLAACIHREILSHTLAYRYYYCYFFCIAIIIITIISIIRIITIIFCIFTIITIITSITIITMIMAFWEGDRLVLWHRRERLVERAGGLVDL